MNKVPVKRMEPNEDHPGLFGSGVKEPVDPDHEQDAEEHDDVRESSSHGTEIGILRAPDLLNDFQQAGDKTEAKMKEILKKVKVARLTYKDSRFPAYLYQLEYTKDPRALETEIQGVVASSEAVQHFIQNTLNFQNYQPSQGDVQALVTAPLEILHALWLMNLKQFVETHDHVVRTKGLFKPIGKEEFDDQNQRAQKVAELIQERSRDLQQRIRLVLLDGHGRMMFLILKHLFASSFDADRLLTVVLVDIDDSTNDFHDLFFPSTVQIVRGSLLSLHLKSTDVVYANFCSIPSSIDTELQALFNEYLQGGKTVCCKETVLYWAFEVVEQGIPLVISFLAATGPMRTQYEMVATSGCLTALGLQRFLLDTNIFPSTKEIGSRSLQIKDKIVYSSEKHPITVKTSSQHSGIFVTIALTPPVEAPHSTYLERRLRLDHGLLHAGLKHLHPELIKRATFQALHGAKEDKVVTYTVKSRTREQITAMCDDPKCLRLKKCQLKSVWRLSDILVGLDSTEPLFIIREE